MEKIQWTHVAPHNKQIIDMGDMCRTYFVAWIHISLTSFVRTQLKRPINPLHIG
jgi:hypothetical protein